MSSNTRECQYCEWFEPVSATRKANDGYGDCRRNPPDANGWPTVLPDHWCGEFVFRRVGKPS